jgi:hypothetical protein
VISLHDNPKLVECGSAKNDLVTISVTSHSAWS